jgi:hypothetical protein
MINPKVIFEGVCSINKIMTKAERCIENDKGVLYYLGIIFVS